MTTIDTLMKSIAPETVDPDSAVVEADLARGRAALTVARRRRTYRRASAGIATLAVAAVAVAVTVSTSGSSVAGSARSTAGTHAVAHTPGTGRSGAGIQLVAFDGTQLPGFTVSQIPEGWQLSTSVSTALCITPNGSSNNDPDDFEGKLCVLPQSVDEIGLGPGVPVTVSGMPGHIDRADSGPSGGAQLRYITTDKHTVDVQVPAALNWSNDQIVAFAEGVKVTEHIGVTRG